MEYQWLPHRLKLNGAICLQSLSSQEVAKYLARGGSKLAALRDAVNSDPVLQELTQTPLMLSIMSLAYQGAGGEDLARQKGDSPEECRKQIFDLYLGQMFQRRGTPTFPKHLVFPAWPDGRDQGHRHRHGLRHPAGRESRKDVSQGAISTAATSCRTTPCKHRRAVERSLTSLRKRG
jgi:hypothetical protein